MTTEQLDIQTIVRVAAQTIKQELNILTDEEHAFLKAWLVREKRAEERWEKIKTHVLGWGVVAFVGWIGTVLFDSVVHIIKRGGQ